MGRSGSAIMGGLRGPVGLVLATPLTVCLVVLGRHVEHLKFLDVLLGDRPALSPSELFYQRMLAEDPAEAVYKAEEFLKQKPLSMYYDEVVLPGLQLAERDLARGALDRVQSEKIKAAVIEVIDDLVDEDDGELASETTDGAEFVAALELKDDATVSVLKRQKLAPEWQVNLSSYLRCGRGCLMKLPPSCWRSCLKNAGLGYE